MRTFATVISGETTWADIMFLVATILFVICAVLAIIRQNVEDAVLKLGLAAVALGLLLL